MKTLYALLSCLVLLVVAAGAARAMDGVTQGGGDTPEPSSMVMVGIGVAAGGYAVYRNRRARAGTQRGQGDAKSRAPGGSTD